MATNSRGFTLLEVLIAVVILAFLSMYTSNSIQSATRNKVKIQGQIDRNSTVRDALKIVSRDIKLAFNYRDISIKLHNEAQKARKERDTKKKNDNSKNNNNNENGESNTGEQTGNNNQQNNNQNNNANNPPKEYKLKEEKILTHFLGEAEKVNFTSLSNIRQILDSKVSDQAEVGYSVKPCRGRLNKKKSSNCLWRRVSSIIDDDVTEGGQESVLVENVQSFKLRYIGPGRETEWVDQWRSDESGDANTKGNFPYAVEVSLEVHDKDDEKAKSVAMTMVAPLRFPNNPKPETEEEKKQGTENNETTSQNGQTDSQ